MPIRYDNQIQFHNPTAKAFVGRWDGEDYLIESGETTTYPMWMAKQFAKRLCDQVMIKKYGEPLKDDHKKRLEFMAQCLPEIKLHSAIDTKPKTTKEQIEEDRKYLYASKEERIAQLQRQIEELQNDDREDEKRPMGLQENNDPTQVEDEDLDELPGATGLLIADDEDEDELPIEDDEELEDEDEPYSPEEREKAAAAVIRKDSKKTVKDFEEGKLKNIKNRVGTKQVAVKDKREKQTPIFDGSASTADSKLHSSIENDLALQADE